MTWRKVIAARRAASGGYGLMKVKPAEYVRSYEIKDKMEFKEIRGEESLSLYGIYRLCMFEPTPQKFRKKMSDFLSDRSVQIYACRDDSGIMGVCVCRKCDGQAEICGIAVREDIQRRGTGSFMIKKLREAHERLFAETDADAVGFYRKNGFEIKEKSVNYGGEAVTRFECRL